MIRKTNLEAGSRNLPVRFDGSGPLHYIKYNLGRILHGNDPHVRKNRLPGGLATNTWLLTFKGGNLQVVLKEVADPGFYKDQSLLTHLTNLAQYSDTVIQAFGEVDVGTRIFVLYEYAPPVRETTLNDAKAVLVEILRAAERYAEVHPARSIDNFSVDFIKSIGLDIFDDKSLVELISEPDLIMIGIEKVLANYFISNKRFLERLCRLPVRFVHSDLKIGNILMTANGPKVIDWDEALFERRIREIAVFVIRSLEYEKGNPDLRIIPELLQVLKEANFSLTDLEKEMFLLYLVLAIIETDVWMFSVIRKKAPKIRDKIINSSKQNWTFLRLLLSQDTAQLGWPPLSFPSEIQAFIDQSLSQAS